MPFLSLSGMPSNLQLTNDTIHIWRAALDQSASQFQRLEGILSMDERMRAERFRFEQDRKRFIVGRGILRNILGCYLSVEPSRLQFCYGKNGKPALAATFGKGGIHFNLSKSDGIALFAFTRDHEIGVDIEHIRDISEMDEIAEKFFSKRENEVFHTLPEPEKKEAFFNCWTRKEAFIKAIGDGLSFRLDRFDVSLASSEPAQLLRTDGDSKVMSKWLIQNLNPAAGFAAAFAIKGRNWRLHCWQWSDSSIKRSNSTLGEAYPRCIDFFCYPSLARKTTSHH